MNFKKTALSLSVSSLLFVSASSLMAQETGKDNEKFIRALPTLLSFILSSSEEVCEAPTQLSIVN